MTAKTNTINRVIKLAKRCVDTCEFVRKLKKMGFKHLGSGACRTGYGNGKLVVKLGEHQENVNEYDNWERVQKNPIWKWATIPIYGVHACAFDDEDVSLLFCAQAKPFECIQTDECIYHYIDGARAVKKVHNKQWAAISNMFDDVHNDNIMLFGKALVVVDLNIAPYDEAEKHAKRWASAINFENHKKAYVKQSKLVLQS